MRYCLPVSRMVESGQGCGTRYTTYLVPRDGGKSVPRRPRLLFAGGTYHVTARGNNGGGIFRDDHDRVNYLQLLANAARMTDARILAYVLMSNHVHLVVQTPAPNLDVLIHGAHRPYAVGFNRRYGRTGHLFGSRYRSIPILDDTHLLEATRYIHRNPVRAGLVQRPEDFLWSSYRTYIKPQADGDLVDPGRVLDLLARDRKRGRTAYEKFVLSALEVPGTENTTGVLVDRSRGSSMRTARSAQEEESGP
jgi:REP element-mobilizing transposase RayT